MTDNKALADRLTVDSLAQAIREVDGRHDLGAGALAEALLPRIAALTATPSAQAGEVEDEARRLYNKHSGNHPTIHCNRLPAWSELSEGTRDAWRAKAVAASPQPQGDAAPQVSGGGDDEADATVKRAFDAFNGTLVPSLRLPNTLTFRMAMEIAIEAALSTPRAHEPAPTVDGGAFGWWLTDCNGVGRFSRRPTDLADYQTTPGYSATPLYLHPTPAMPARYPAWR